MRHALAAALLLLAAPAGAATIVIDFEEEATGNRGTSFVSAECGGCVTFSGSDRFEFLDWGQQSHGIGLAAGEDEDSEGFWMDFTTPVSALSLEFGNDETTGEPNTPVPGDVARLRAYLGAVLVGEVTVVLNLNDVMDQTIALSGVGPFDRAEFIYAGAGIDEIVDNITFETVPEPGTLGLGALVLAAAARRRRVSAATESQAVARAQYPGDQGPNLRPPACKVDPDTEE